MIKDNRGQVALEYLLILAISLILLIVFTLPLTQSSIQNTLDVSDAINVKSDLSALAHGVKTVYGQGQGSKQTVTITSQRAYVIDIAGDHVSTTIKLKDGSSKNIKVSFKSNLPKSELPISKGENNVVVEWQVDSKNMGVYKR